MSCYMCNTTTYCQCSNHIDIYEKNNKFVQDTIYNTNISNQDLSDHLLKHISTLKLIELYLLAKHIPEYRRPNDIFSEEARAGYIDIIYNTYLREIKERRKELYVLYHTEHIVNAGNEEAIYNCIVREITNDPDSLEELLDMLLYGVDQGLFDKEDAYNVNNAVFKVHSKCVLCTDESGNPILRFIECLDLIYTCVLPSHAMSVFEPYSCGICYEEYPNSKNRVYLGDCTHSFCFECVQKHAITQCNYNSYAATAGTTIECPFCRTKTNKLEFASPTFLNKFTPIYRTPSPQDEYVSIMDFL